MYSCAKPPKNAKTRLGDCRPSAKAFQSLKEIVQDYINNCRREAKAELGYFGGQRNLPTAIRVAAEATIDGIRHPHQRRIHGDTLKAFGHALSRKSKELRACQTFPELMQISKKVSKGFWDHSRLSVYDTTLRIGAHLGIMPDRVYLHAGVKEGAKALGFSVSLGFLVRSQLPKEFQKLKPWEIEHCLCIYKKEFKRLSSRRGQNRCLFATRTSGRDRLPASLTERRPRMRRECGSLKT